MSRFDTLGNAIQEANTRLAAAAALVQPLPPDPDAIPDIIPRTVSYESNTQVTNLGKMKFIFFYWLETDIRGEVRVENNFVRGIPDNWCMDEVRSYLIKVEGARMQAAFTSMAEPPGNINVVIIDTRHIKYNVTATFEEFPSRFNLVGRENDKEVRKLSTLFGEMQSEFQTFVLRLAEGKKPMKRPYYQ